jgi:Surface adhesin CshA non-repetitive domain 2
LLHPRSVLKSPFRTLARLLATLAMFWAMPSLAAVCNPAATQGTAPAGWQTYCWLDMASYNDATARTATGQNFSFTLSDGSTMTFNLKTSGTPAIVSKTAPSWSGAAVGNTAFLGIAGSPILYQQAGGTNTITISSILITPPPGVPAATAYSFVAADAESTNNGESLSFNTNGSGWTILDQVDPITGSTYPTISGTGTATFTETGVAGTVGGYIVGSNSATTVTTTLVGGGLQGTMFAVRFASIRLNKQIVGARVNAADQFKFDIKTTSGGAIIATGTSSGTSLGPFNAAAVSLASSLPLTVSETMATGSVGTLADYSSRLTCVNDNSGSSTPLPTNVATTSYNMATLQFGDALQCTFRNTPFPHVSLQKALGLGGRLFAVDQFTMNISAGTTTIATTTTTGTGTTVTNGATPMTLVTAGTNYGLSEAASSSTILSQYTSTMSCTNANASSTTTLPTSVPGSIVPALGDVVTCTITNTKKAANATLTATKTSAVVSDPINGTTNPKMIPGAVVAYSISIANTGTLAVDSSTIFIDDPLPSTVTYNAGSTVSFANGAIASGLTFNAATDVKFSNAVATPANFAACTYTPTGGFDANVKHVCIRPSGVMTGATAAGQPSFTVTFQARIN